MPAVSGNCSDVLHGRLKFLTTHHQERTSTQWGTTQLFVQVVLVPNVLVDRHTTIQNWVYLWSSHFVRISARCLHVWTWGRKGLPKRPRFIQVLRPTLVFVENVKLSFETCRKIYIHNTYGLCSTSKTTYRNIFVSTLYRFTQIYTYNVSVPPPFSPNKTAVFQLQQQQQQQQQQPSMYIYYNTRPWKELARKPYIQVSHSRFHTLLCLLRGQWGVNQLWFWGDFLQFRYSSMGIIQMSSVYYILAYQLFIALYWICTGLYTFQL